MRKFYFYSEDCLGIVEVHAKDNKEAEEKLLNSIIEDVNGDVEEANEIFDECYHYITIDKVIE